MVCMQLQTSEVAKHREILHARAQGGFRQLMGLHVICGIDVGARATFPKPNIKCKTSRRLI